MFLFFFFFNDTATTEIYTLSLHDALPISGEYIGDLVPSLNHHTNATAALIVVALGLLQWRGIRWGSGFQDVTSTITADRKSTRLNSSHLVISYAVFCLKKKKQL